MVIISPAARRKHNLTINFYEVSKKKKLFSLGLNERVERRK